MSLALALFLLVCGLAALAAAGDSLARGAVVIVVTLFLLGFGLFCGVGFFAAGEIANPIHVALWRQAYGGAGFTSLAFTAMLLRSRKG